MMEIIVLKLILGASLSIQWLRPHLPMQEVGVQSLVRKLRSHMPQHQKTKTKQKQYCNKFDKDLIWEKKKKATLEQTSLKLDGGLLQSRSLKVGGPFNHISTV